jgi:hypothetical protein
MTDFTYVSYTSYREDAFFGGMTRFQYNATGGTITDPTNGNALRPDYANDDTFQVTESFTLYPDPDDPTVEVELTYIGTVEVNGELMPVFESVFFGDLYLFSQNIDRLPSSLDVTTINEGEEYSFAMCFAEGTRIATPAGEVAVETLAPGDLVLTADGRAVPVLWIGVQTLRRGLAHQNRTPIRIAQGALGGGLPHRDLVVTADHGMVLDGVIVTAGALANGTTVRPVDRLSLPPRYRVWHVETEAHEVLLAEGAPTESFVCYVGRAAYDNFDGYLALYGAERIIPEMSLPRITAERMMTPALRARLLGGVAETEIRAA